ncbi:MAG: hypothetical protein C4520_15705 [Candidatus Abyssobacteria bacterium SURF_5]|uniref:ATP-binding protein n=1 Tax=Abyssobacteria bacterium (strain SURF_5) TaxID=2093360 RepID=A0A3A4NDT6_ABYX5|nr:MAG: hypothetical protein C4520_15705 [Candidatus Abyssubacteria bacterium SURF_5]
MEAQRQQARRAIEALRSGVPNRDAVSVLECGQNRLEQLFRRNLEATREVSSDGLYPKGLLVSGRFGTGKSHLLEYFQHIALEENFICSKIVISKETPLYDPVKLFRAAADTAMIQGRRGSAIAEVGEALNISSKAYFELCEWANTSTEISPFFSATIFLLSRLNQDPERRDRIFRFWAGEKLGVAELRRYLRECGEAVSFKIDQVKLRDLALQRFKFVPRLMQAAGYSGWVLLIDEVELIGCYSFRQRAKSYAELARWRGDLRGEKYPGLTTVLAITADFQTAILLDKGDLENVPGKLRAMALSDTWIQIAEQAEKGMHSIQQSVQLDEPNEETRKQIFNDVREIYSKAYDWQPPSTSTFSRFATTSTRMREYIRGWITEWDLKRLYPTYQSKIEVKEIPTNYIEDEDLQPKEETD